MHDHFQETQKHIYVFYNFYTFEIAQIVEILPLGKQGLLMSRRCITAKLVSASGGLLKIYVEIPQYFASHFLLENLAICFVWCLFGGQPLMLSSNGNIFHITGPLCGEFTSRWWIPVAKSSDVELWCFLWPASEVTVELVNNRDASDLRRLHTHYDITVMCVWSNGD